MLASGRRASEINGLSGLPGDISRERDGSFTLRFLSDFLAKNQTPGSLSPVLRILPLTSILCPDDIDRRLCPVRSLRRYLRFSRAVKSDQRRLFVSHNPSHKGDIRVSTISRWVREVISRAYKQGHTTGSSVCNPKAHEVPGIPVLSSEGSPRGRILEVTVNFHRLLPPRLVEYEIGRGDLGSRRRLSGGCNWPSIG